MFYKQLPDGNFLLIQPNNYFVFSESTFNRKKKKSLLMIIDICTNFTHSKLVDNNLLMS